MHEYVCYCLQSTVSPRTYVGVTNNLVRRLRQHNQELVGGAKYTKKGGPWLPAVVVGPFMTYQHALHFEWHWKHMKPRALKGLKGRLQKLQTLVTTKINWPLQVYFDLHRVTQPPALPPQVCVQPEVENVLQKQKAACLEPLKAIPCITERSSLKK